VSHRDLKPANSLAFATGLKIPSSQEREGSTPSSPTAKSLNSAEGAGCDSRPHPCHPRHLRHLCPPEGTDWAQMKARLPVTGCTPASPSSAGEVWPSKAWTRPRAAGAAQRRAQVGSIPSRGPASPLVDVHAKVAQRSVTITMRPPLNGKQRFPQTVHPPGRGFGLLGEGR
jgi:hypothetical protein